jgi:DNA-directed RNA polymerase sigma subunit (sigma70/sigma32)
LWRHKRNSDREYTDIDFVESKKTCVDGDEDNDKAFVIDRLKNILSKSNSILTKEEDVVLKFRFQNEFTNKMGLLEIAKNQDFLSSIGLSSVSKEKVRLIQLSALCKIKMALVEEIDCFEPVRS